MQSSDAKLMQSSDAKAMRTPGAKLDCVVIGAGHNGLVCATLLARSGRRVLVLEAGPRVGGAAATREFAPGYRVSAGAHLVHLMPASLARELELESHGLEWAATRLPTTALRPGGAALGLDAASIAAALGPAEAEAFRAYSARMQRFAAALTPMLTAAPPRLGTDDWSDRFGLLRLGWQIRRLGRRDMRELLRIGGMNAHDLLEEHFASSELQGALGLDAVLGSNFGPRSPGSVLTLLYRLAAEAGAGGTGLAQPRGGVGALCAALERAASAAGAAVRTDAPVAEIRVEADRACGVTLETGERIDAATVVSSADPKTTFLTLLGPRHLDTGFVRRVQHIRAQGLAAKLHLALDRLPEFTGLERARLGGRLLIAPSLQHIEHAFNHAKYGEYSAAPVMEITLPTVNDPALAPAGRQVLSVIVQYAPYALRAGWDTQREHFVARCLETLEHHAPGIRATVSAHELLTPVDMEREFRIRGGHWHHGDLAFDQFLMVRPVPGAAQYRTPVEGLYLCGAGCHPGGGVMGTAGSNAAAQILKQAA
jgi:phytoene dehydrogenase-like protein